MPTEIYIAVLAACSCIVILTALLLAAAVYLKARTESMEKGVAQLKADLSELIQESRVAVTEMRAAAASMALPMADIGHMTRTARGWADRADRLVDAVGAIAEPPLFLVSKNIKSVGGIVSGVLQMLLNPKP
jgi:hypothetical protein